MRLKGRRASARQGCSRVVADKLSPDRFADLVDIGVDEISWRRHHKYLTLVSDHETGKIVWGTEGKNAAPARAIIMAGRPLSQVPIPSTPFRSGSERMSRRSTIAASLR